MTRSHDEHTCSRTISMVSVLLLIAAFLILQPPQALAADQIQQQLNQALKTGYQEHDRDRIMDSVQECLKSGAEPETITSLVEQASKSGIDAEHVEKMLQQMTRAGQFGIPTGPVADKAMEGMVKQVQAQNIVQAMERVRERLEFASGQMARLEGFGFTKEDRDLAVMDTADALAAGMERKHVQQVFGDLEKEASRVRSEETLRKRTMTSIEAMKRIRGYGVPSEQVANLCGEMILNRYTEREMEQVMGEFAMARSRNRNMVEFSRSMENSMGESGHSWGSGGGGMDGGGSTGGSSMGGGGSTGGGGMGGGGMGGGGMGGGGKH